KELDTWYKLDHPNLVPLLGVTTAVEFGDFPSMVSSWMMNGLLTEYLKSKQQFDRMELIKGIAEGVAYLHSNNVIHGDLRASSILIDELGNPAVADTGLLKI
ncbi:kinase-like domain-containing protein, partial [Rhodocollybia butyracea]